MPAPTGIAGGPQPTRSYRLAADGVRLVWTGTAANVRHLFAMAWPLNEFVGSSGARITVVTRLASLPGDLLHPFVDVTFVDWSERAEAQALRSPRIPLAPLIHDPYSRARCGGKLLSYFRAALPVVAATGGAP